MTKTIDSSGHRVMQPVMRRLLRLPMLARLAESCIALGGTPNKISCPDQNTNGTQRRFVIANPSRVCALFGAADNAAEIGVVALVGTALLL